MIFVWGSLLYFRNSEAPKGSMEIFVTGKQWMRKVEHPEGQREQRSARAAGPPGKADHDFRGRDPRFLFVPAFRVKKDVLLGRYTTLRWL